MYALDPPMLDLPRPVYIADKAPGIYGSVSDISFSPDTDFSNSYAILSPQVTSSNKCLSVVCQLIPDHFDLFLCRIGSHPVLPNSYFLLSDLGMIIDRGK